jgi:hypothetical protein
MISEAISYARAGWPVFPLQPGTKDPLEGSHGFRDAITDVELVRDHWVQYPDHNIGIALGHGIAVLDFDIPRSAGQADGRLTWEQSAKTLRRKILGIVQTPSGGIHVYVEARPLSGGGAKKYAPGLDIKAVGGYVAAPGSRLDKTDHYPFEGEYTWLTKPTTLT